jgi:5-deoxy-glucuronate isomerase
VIRTVVAAGEQTDLIQLHRAELEPHERLDLACEAETAVVVLGGVVDAAADGAALGRAGGRASVFDGPGHTVYAPPGTGLGLVAGDGPVSLAIASAPLADAPPAPARVIAPGEVRVGEVGRGNWSRSVRTVLGPEHAAGRLLLGETVNPPGNWSSYPPHKHDRQAPPEEVRLEEVYLFKTDPPGGFGVQIRYDDRGEELCTVRDDDAAAIRSGYHPVVAAPGYALWYLWVMAGDGRQMVPYFDPRHAWVQDPPGR